MAPAGPGVLVRAGPTVPGTGTAAGLPVPGAGNGGGRLVPGTGSEGAQLVPGAGSNGSPLVPGAGSSGSPLVPGECAAAWPRGRGARKTGGVMGLIAEHDGALDGYEAVQLPPAPAESGCRGAAMLRRRSPRTSKRAVLYLHCLADSFVPEDLASWYTERGFHFYVADLRPQARLDQPAGGRRSPLGLGECFSALDAM